MTERLEITPEELALVLEALDDAAFYRDARSHVLKSAMKRRNRRLSAPTVPTTSSAEESDPNDVHLAKARAYGRLAAKLRKV